MSWGKVTESCISSEAFNNVCSSIWKYFHIILWRFAKPYKFKSIQYFFIDIQIISSFAYTFYFNSTYVSVGGTMKHLAELDIVF